MTFLRAHDPGRARRRAFTLTELLVVIAIIAILTALSAASYFYFIGTQQRRNTEATVRTVHTTLMQHWSHVIDEAKREPIAPAVLTLAGNDQTRARVIMTKLRLMEAFPVSFTEVLNANTDPSKGWVNPVYVYLGDRLKYAKQYPRKVGSAATNANHKPETESAACLLMALSTNRGGTSLSADDLGPAVADLDNDGLQELIDGWHQPFYFYRAAWSMPNPLGAPDLQQSRPAAKSAGTRRNFADPLDPTGTLLNGGWYNQPYGGTTCGRAFETFFHKISRPGASPPEANYVIPVLVSAGKDTQLSLYPPFHTDPAQSVVQKGLAANPTASPTAVSDALDNVYSYKVGD